MPDLKEFRWSDLSALAAVVVAIIGLSKVRYDQGVFEGTMDQRMKGVEDATIDAKASIRLVPSLQNSVDGVRTEVQGLRAEFRDQNKKIDDLLKDVYRRSGK